MSRILVVDDKELMRDSGATTIVRAGHSVISAATAPVALKNPARRPCEEVVPGLKRPGVGGLRTRDLR